MTSVDCPAGSTWHGSKCTGAVDKSCSAGMHFETGRGCVANAASNPAAPAQPAPSSPTASVGSSAAMIRIPAGTFMMGSEQGPGDQRPVHSVTVASFEMDVTEVTVSAYLACVRAGKCSQSYSAPYCNTQQAGKDNHPFNCVDWNPATSYCAAVGKSLPTEEEWEYAVKGTDGREFLWGQSAPAGRLCWQRRDRPQGTCPVGSYPSGDSPFGLHDMAGNLWEWTSSGYSAHYNEPRGDDTRVTRGGSFVDSVDSLITTSVRYARSASNWTGANGFRCAR